MAGGKLTGNSTSTNMSGLRIKPGLSISRRTFRVRDVGIKLGQDLAHGGLKCLSLVREGDLHTGAWLEILAFALEKVRQDPDMAQVGQSIPLRTLIEALPGRDIP